MEKSRELPPIKRPPPDILLQQAAKFPDSKEPFFCKNCLHSYRIIAQPGQAEQLECREGPAPCVMMYQPNGAALMQPPRIVHPDFFCHHHTIVVE